MDITDIRPQLDDLSVSIDNLEAALKPLIDDLGSVASKLPLLDKAKLNVMTCYAIESLLFCEYNYHPSLDSGLLLLLT